MTTPNNICDRIEYQNAILLKQRFKIMNTPPLRYDNLANNPYLLSFTQSQLDMRRKAEILKYTATKTNTKTNNLTRSERWAQLINGSTQQRSLSSSFIKLNTISQTTNTVVVQTCPSGTIITTPSYSSNIPGPITNLYLDPDVPIYNLIPDQNAYGIINQEQYTLPFIYDQTQIDKPLSLINYIPQNTVTLTSIYIKNFKLQKYSFNITFPLSMYIYADVSMNNSTLKNTELYSNNISLNLYNNKLPFFTTVKYATSIMTNIAYDLIVNISNTATFNVSMTPNVLDPSNNHFYGNQYIGTCTINNFRLVNNAGFPYQSGLNVQPGYIYDIILNSIKNNNTLLNITIPNPNTFFKYFNQPTYGYFINVSKTNANTFINCTSSGSFPDINKKYTSLIVL